MKHGIVLSSRVRLARNYEDIPFDAAQRPEYADMCINRTVAAMKNAKLIDDFDFLRLRDMSETSRQAMAESRLISRDLLSTPENSAVLLRTDDSLSIMMNEDDHLRIQAIRPELNLLEAASACFQVDDALSRQVAFAFDEQLGYLTACPTNTGTGMRASVLIHLPMLTRGKQMGNVGQLVAKVGLTIRGVYGEGSEALGNIYQISNQVTLGRTEQELISAVTAVSGQLCDMEAALRDKALKEDRIAVEDIVFRAWGTLNHARLLPLPEFYQLWSNVRLGTALGLVKCPIADALLDQAQPAHLRVYADEPLDDRQVDECRANRIRELIRMVG